MRLRQTAPSTSVQRCEMRIDRQQQTSTRVIPGLVVRLGCIPVVDQQAILVGEVVHKVVQVGLSV